MTILGAMSLRGMIATMTIEEATDADIFLAYVEHVLCPALKPGDVVVMDNLEHFRFTCCHFEIMQGGVFLRKTPLCIQVSVKTRIENAVSSHKVNGVRKLIQAAGAEVLYLPPYSPDLNPIEKAWAKLKQLLRSIKARTKEALDQAIAEALKLISADNAQAWFKHCLDGLR